MLAILLVWIHVLSVLWLVSGVLGRDVAYGQAGRSADLNSFRALAALGSRFERAMVRPATLVVLLTGIGAAHPRGWAVLGALQGGSANWVLVALIIYLSIIPWIVFVFLPRGKAYRRALEAAEARNAVTPELQASLNDGLMRAGRVYEMVMIAVLAYLMVAKPF